MRNQISLIALAWCGVVASAGAQSHRVATELIIRSEGKDYELTRIGALLELARGEIVVHQVGDAEVLVFDSKGHLSRRIGRRGGGPGEMMAPGLLGVRGDSIWVWDKGLARISLFDSDWHFVRSIPMRWHGTGVLLQDGTVATVPISAYTDRSSRFALRRMSADGEQLSTLLDVADPSRLFQLSLGKSSLVGAQPFDDQPLLAVAEDGTGFIRVERTTVTAAGTSARFLVTRLDHRGDTVYSVVHKYRPVPVSDAVIEEAVRARAVPQLQKDNPGLTDRVRSALYRPPHLPTITAVIIARDWSVWLRREEDPRGSRWTVLRPNGTLSFDVQIPHGLSLRAVGPKNLWAVKLDSLGVPSLHKLRLLGI